MGVVSVNRKNSSTPLTRGIEVGSPVLFFSFVVGAWINIVHGSRDFLITRFSRFSTFLKPYAINAAEGCLIDKEPQPQFWGHRVQDVAVRLRFTSVFSVVRRQRFLPIEIECLEVLIVVGVLVVGTIIIVQGLVFIGYMYGQTCHGLFLNVVDRWSNVWSNVPEHVPDANSTQRFVTDSGTGSVFLDFPLCGIMERSSESDCLA